MSKIINVDFKNKRLEYTWDDLSRQRLVKQIELDLQSVLNDIATLLGEKDPYLNSAAYQLAKVVAELREKL